jgi:DNA repair protein RadD
VFCAGLKHAEHVRAEFQTQGVSAVCVFGDTQGRDRIFRDFREGRFRALINVEVGTTGLDIPQIDLIALLRPTKSPGLLTQIAGRGSRALPGTLDGLPDDVEARKDAIARSSKPSCLFLDFTQTLREIGPLDEVRPPRKKGAKKNDEDREPPTKVCPKCRNVVAPSTRSCGDCGHEWPPPELKHLPTASSARVMSTEPVEPTTLRVLSVSYHRHSKAGSPDSFRIDYRYGPFDKVSDWLCFEHKGQARTMAEIKWRKIAYPGSRIPHDVGDALDNIDDLKTPVSVVVREEGKYLRVVRVIHDSAPRQTVNEKKLECEWYEEVF